MAGAGSEQRELLALMHQHLVQLGYERAAKELLEQSGQKTFPSCAVPLREIFTQWKKTSSPTLKPKAADIKGGPPAKIRVPDPKSSSESSEEEETPITTKTNLPVNNSTKLKKKATEEESSSEDSDSSSEEEAVARKNVKTPVAGSVLQLAGQKTNSIPGKGEAVAAIQPKGQQNKPASNKSLPPAATKIGPNKGITNKVRPTSQALVSGEQQTAQAALTRAAKNSESSSSSSSSASESEEGRTLNVVKITPSKPELKKAESTSEESSDDSDSEEESKAAAVQLKSSGTKPLKNAVSSLPLNKTASASTPSKPTIKPSVTSFAKPPPPSKEAESSESSESSSENENETMPVPVSQKRMQTPQLSMRTKQNQAEKPGALPKAVTGALKGKKAQTTTSSSSSDSEDENVPSSCKLSAPFATTASSAVQPTSAVKPQTPQGSLQKAKQSEDSSEDSSDDSDSEEDTVYAQKPAQAIHKVPPLPVKIPAAKSAGVPSGKPGNAQLAGKGVAGPPKSLPKASESSETDSSDSSQSKEAEKPAKQPPIHPFFKQMAGKAAVRSGKSLQTNSNTPNSTSKKCQSPAKKATGKVEQSSPTKTKALAAKPSGIPPPKASSSDSSSDSEVAPSATVAQPAGTQQKPEADKQSESSSKESSDDDHNASQSLLSGLSPRTIQASFAAKSASSPLSKQSSGKASIPAIGAQAKASGKTAPAESTSSTDSSSGDSETEETVKQKTEITTLPPSGRKGVPAKLGKVAAAATSGGKNVQESSGSKAPPAKKATAKAQSNGQALGSSAAPLPVPLSPLLKAHTAGVGYRNNEEAAPHNLHPSCVVEPKGAKEKLSKKRKVAVGDTDTGEPKGKKLKKESSEEVLMKKKKKKKKKKAAKSSGSIKSPKEKDGKEKKSDKKKKKSKNLGTLNADGPQKKKKKKKKIEKPEGAA